MSYRPVFQAEEAYHPRFQEGEVFSSGLHEGIDVAALRDHTRLLRREEADQHPIQAITGLAGELQARVTSQEVSQQIDRQLVELTNLEIVALWNGS